MRQNAQKMQKKTKSQSGKGQKGISFVSCGKGGDLFYEWRASKTKVKSITFEFDLECSESIKFGKYILHVIDVLVDVVTY